MNLQLQSVLFIFLCSNEGIEEPDQEPVLGCFSLTQDAPFRQSGRHDYASFNGQRSHPGHRGHQPQFL